MNLFLLFKNEKKNKVNILSDNEYLFYTKFQYFWVKLNQGYKICQNNSGKHGGDSSGLTH